MVDSLEMEINSVVGMCKAARAAGGISAYDVIDHPEILPEGWKLDPYTHYWLPPQVALIKGGARYARDH